MKNDLPTAVKHLPGTPDFRPSGFSAKVKGTKALWRQERIYRLDWVDLGLFLEQLRSQITADDFWPSTVLAIARGGLVPAVYLSGALDCLDLRIMGIARNTDDRLYSRKQEPELRWMAPQKELHGSSVLIVDDIVGAGATLATALDMAYDWGASEVRSAVIARNCESALKPDYCCAEVDDWVVFPWEKQFAETQRSTVPLARKWA